MPLPTCSMYLPAQIQLLWAQPAPGLVVLHTLQSTGHQKLCSCVKTELLSSAAAAATSVLIPGTTWAPQELPLQPPRGHCSLPAPV